MLILVDARSMGSSPSGIGMYVYNFLKELCKYEELEFILVSDVSVSLEMKYFIEKGIKVVNYGKKVNKNLGLFGYYKFIQKMIKQEKPVLFWEPNNLMPVRIKNPYGKIMITIHDLFPITTPEYYGLVYENYFKYGLKKTAGFTDIVLYNSLESKRDMERYYPVIKEKKYFVSYIIINKIQAGQTADKNYFLYVGNLEKRKGADLLIKSFARYRKEGGTKELYLGGKMREASIQELLDSVSKTTSGIHYAGYLDEESKNKLYADCSCFVFPSKAEGFGMPTVEVMNFNKPIIASNLSIFEEILEDNVTYVDINCSEEEQIQNLCRAMFDYKEAEIEQYGKIVERYDAPGLGKALKDFLIRL